MSSPVITCPECSKKFKGQANLEGKKIRCPFCKQPFRVPSAAPEPVPAAKEKKTAPEPAAPPPEPEKKKDLWGDEDEGTMKNYDLGEFHIKARCPNCAKELLSEKDVVCVYCGYNNLTRTFAESKKIIETTGSEHLAHLFPGLCAVFGMFLLIVAMGFISAVFPFMNKLRFLDSQGVRVMLLFFIVAPGFFSMGVFAFNRLILDPKPREKEKDYAMLVGQKLGPYAIDRELGSGAMGTVFRGKHQETGERVAIKLMSPSLGSNDMALLRFERETEIIKQLDHPNIVRLVRRGHRGKNPFYVMEYVEGDSLDKVLARRGRFSWEESVRIATQICEALYHAHQMGIVHRDLKPSNLMIMKDGTVKLMDFGIAKDLDQTALTETNRTVGTASYMSPEQCRGDKRITDKSDLYSLGVMLYELLTGRKPFHAESAMEMFIKHNKGTFERPSRLCLDIPIWLDTLVCQLLEKVPDDRPFDAMVVHQALTKIREKVETQQSAGIERAKARRIDRTDHQPALDKTDLEAARTLLHKKKRKVPFYRKTWFMVLGLIGMAALSGYLFYWIVIKPPSAEGLLRDIDAAMKSDEIEVRESMLKTDSALANFSYYYGDHPRAAELRQWRDNVLGDQCERQMYKRRGTTYKVEEGEKIARLALDDEDLGRLQQAKRHWEELAAFKDKPDDAERAWGLVAVKYVKLHDDAKKLESDLAIRSRQKEKLDKESDPERLAIEALQAEFKKKTGAALELWEKTKKVVDAESSQRTYYLIAADHVRALKRK